MVQDNYPEQEVGSRKQEASEQTAEERPDFEDEKQRIGDKEEKMEKPTIPNIKRPEMPSEENIPAGGPGNQGQTQTTQPQTQEDKTEKIKKELERPIHINTPQERKESSEIEDKHNKNVLSQP